MGDEENNELYGPDDDFLRAWYKDEKGRNCRVGLTFDETREYEGLLEEFVKSHTAHAGQRKRLPDEDRRRHTELQRLHDIALQERRDDPDDYAKREQEFFDRKK